MTERTKLLATLRLAAYAANYSRPGFLMAAKLGCDIDQERGAS
jgi:hypothetical protein